MRSRAARALAWIVAGAALTGCERVADDRVDHIATTRDTLRSLRVPGLPPGLASTAFASGFTPKAEAAWISDELEPPPAAAGAVPRRIRFNALAERHSDGWRITEISYSRSLSDAEAAAGAEATPPAEAADAVPPEAASLARQFRSEFGARHAPLFAEREDAVAICPAGERAFGGEPAREVLRTWWKQGSRPEITGRVRARVLAGGAIGWASGTLTSTRNVEGRDVRMPFHVATVYVRNGTGWRLVQAHVSHAVPAAAIVADALRDEQR